MALAQTNTTCDIYRSGNPTSNPPDVPGVKIMLTPDFAMSHEAAIQSGTTGRWTHIALMAATTDVRDGYGNGSPNAEAAYSNWDQVWVPDKNGTKFIVVFVERMGLGTPQDAKRVYLQRQSPTWPTNNL
jgi:hypothetical protein